MTLATSPGYLQYPPPTVYVADAHSSGRPNLVNDLPLVSLPFLMWPSFTRDAGRTSLLHGDSDGLFSGPQRGDQSASVRLLTYSTPSGQYELLLSPIEQSNPSLPEEAGSNPVPTDMETEISDSGMVPMETVEAQPAERSNQFFPFGDPTLWDIPFLQGWLIGQSQAGQLNMRLPHASGHDNAIHATESGNSATVISSSATILNVDRPQSGGRSGSRYRSSQTRVTAASGLGEAAGYDHVMHDSSDPQLAASRMQPELATSYARAAAAAAAELPCTVKLRIWFHNTKDPCAPLDPERCRLTIPHAVLCRYDLPTKVKRSW